MSQTPSCGNTVSYTLDPSNNHFLSVPISNITATTGKIKIFGATINDQKTYVITLTGFVDAKNAFATFSIVIEDPCKTSTIFLTPLKPMSLNFLDQI